MKSLEQEVNRIKNEVTDIACKTMLGKTCEELVQEMFADVVKSVDASNAPLTQLVEQDTLNVKVQGSSP